MKTEAPIARAVRILFMVGRSYGFCGRHYIDTRLEELRAEYGSEPVALAVKELEKRQ